MMVFLSICTALYDYAPQGDNELELHEGEIVYILEKSSEDDWWKAKKRAPSEDEEEPVGLIPNNYVEKVSDLIIPSLKMQPPEHILSCSLNLRCIEVVLTAAARRPIQLTTQRHYMITLGRRMRSYHSRKRLCSLSMIPRIQNGRWWDWTANMALRPQIISKSQAKLSKSLHKRHHHPRARCKNLSRSSHQLSLPELQ